MRRLLSLTALLLLAAGGCGGDDEKPLELATGDQLAVEATEYSFTPDAVEVPGGELELRLENRGKLAHNLRVFDGDRELGGTPTFTGGKTRRAKLRLEPGEYEFVCTVANHAELGMDGKLTVR